MLKCMILSGVPGSGKSYHARKFSSVICSADKHVDYSEVIGPQLPGAHQACWRDALKALQSQEKLVIIDNTNLSSAEIAPYYLMAEALGYYVTICRIHTPFAEAYQQQVHGVPKDIHDKMCLRFQKEDVMPWWNVCNL